MLQTKIVEAVIELGLTEFEAKIYALLVDLKNPTVTELCTQTGSYRRKVYEALEALNQAGLIEHTSDYSRNIKVKSPVVLDTLLKSKQYELNKVSLNYQDLLPQLLSNFFTEGKEPQIQVFDGLNKFKYLFNTLLDQVENDTEILSYNEGQDLYDILDLNYFLNIWVEKRISKKVFARVLANGGSQAATKEKQRDKEKYREVRMLANTVENKGCFWILGSKIILWDTATVKAVVIENKLIADLLSQLFEGAWNA
ncbi:MAG: helix-turn-helix domain-containing protein [bacterium]